MKGGLSSHCKETFATGVKSTHQESHVKNIHG